MTKMNIECRNIRGNWYLTIMHVIIQKQDQLWHMRLME